MEKDWEEKQKQDEYEVSGLTTHICSLHHAPPQRRNKELKEMDEQRTAKRRAKRQKRKVGGVECNGHRDAHVSHRPRRKPREQAGLPMRRQSRAARRERQLH